MGQNELIFIALLAIPAAILILLRINAALVFMALCLGYVLMHFLQTDIGWFSAFFMPHEAVGEQVIQLVLLFGPAALTALFMVHSVRKVPRQVLNVLPALGASGLLALLIVPRLSPDTARAITHENLWYQFSKLQSFVIGAGALASLVMIWLGR